MAIPQVFVHNDIESNINHEDKSGPECSSSPVIDNLSSDLINHPSEKTFVPKFDVLGRLQKFEGWLDEKMGIETQGVELIPDESKSPPAMLNMFLMWWSLTIHVGTLPIGILGPEMGLSFSQSSFASILGSVFGAIGATFCASLGPKLGLRAIATARYSFGFHGAIICSFFNIFGCIGFGVVNVVVVGQLISAVSDYKVNLSVGCVLIGVLSYLVSLFGFKIIHTYEKYAWIVSLIVFIVLAGEIWNKVDPSLPANSTGLAHTGAFLSFLAMNSASCASWGCIAADYYCNYPRDTSNWKIYIFTIGGISIPSSLMGILGAGLSNIASNITSGEDAAVTTYAHPVLAEAYKVHGLGGILGASFHPVGLSKTFLFLLALSVIGNNVAVFYSSGLCIQLISHHLQSVPRFIWSLIAALTITMFAVIGRESLSAVVANLINLLGYWIVSYTFIIILEDKIFRRSKGYNLDVWNTPSGLPLGIAAIVTILVSYLAGGVTGMAQTVYTGPIAQKFGGKGGDVGIPLSGLITLVIYPVTRFFELKIFHK